MNKEELDYWCHINKGSSLSEFIQRVDDLWLDAQSKIDDPKLPYHLTGCVYVSVENKDYELVHYAIRSKKDIINALVDNDEVKRWLSLTAFW